jgi:uncharacterized protein YkwD
MGRVKWKFAPAIVIVAVFVLSCQAALAQSTCTGADIFTAKGCAGDSISPDEQALFQLVEKYRTSKGLPPIRISSSLSVIANRHLLDLEQNLKAFTHSWSNCPYDIKDEKTWGCITDAPKRFNSPYKGQAYETLYRTTTGKVSPQLALDAWQKSTLHNSIILNLGIFKDFPWDEVGIAVDGQYAALWFGTPGSAGAVAAENAGDLTTDQVIASLSKILAINQADPQKWVGFPPDNKVTFDVVGKNIGESVFTITIKTEPDGKLGASGNETLKAIFKEMFPEWLDPEVWSANAAAAIAANRAATRTKLVNKRSIEMVTEGADSVRVRVVPDSKPKYIEIN